MPTISGQLVDVLHQRIFPAEITFQNGTISGITPLSEAPDQFIMPGFIDAHIHIESSMLTPYEFSKIALTHGTIATVSDPHEIANVCGVEGLDYMLENAAHSPLKFNFGAPSCVPATGFETAGATLDAATIDRLLQRDSIKYLAEMMNFPGVLFQDSEVMAKITAAKKHGKPVDGHAPGLKGEQAAQYAAAGISTDHECFTMEEALDKLKAGMYILIREGSAAKNFEALADLFISHPGKLMLCSDDKHPDDLLRGHINQLVQRAVAKGYNLMNVLHAACVLPVQHYGLDVGLLQKGDHADFIVVSDLKDFKVLQTYINGNKVSENGQAYMADYSSTGINNFSTDKKTATDFRLKANEGDKKNIRVIEALDGQIITKSIQAELPVAEGFVQTDPAQDILKLCVVNRYQDTPPAIAFVKGFGLKNGALASSVAHDSHNIIAVGTNDDTICNAVNAIIEHRGGISMVNAQAVAVLPLPVAGLMTTQDAVSTGRQYEQLDSCVKAMGCTLRAPFMTLSFLALPVIPSLKLTDKGLFDVDAFNFADIFS